jgi:hypothetical protein
VAWLAMRIPTLDTTSGSHPFTHTAVLAWPAATKLRWVMQNNTVPTANAFKGSGADGGAGDDPACSSPGRVHTAGAVPLIGVPQLPQNVNPAGWARPDIDGDNHGDALESGPRLRRLPFRACHAGEVTPSAGSCLGSPSRLTRPNGVAGVGGTGLRKPLLWG